MIQGAITAAQVCALGSALGSFVYLLIAIRRVASFAMRRDQPLACPTPVTVLKPVCGLDPELYENLRSFCEQDYPVYQVIFGVREAEDPAVAVIERLTREFPDGDLELVIDGRISGANLKASNLSNMVQRARYDVLAVADSDMRVRRDYLATVTAPLRDARVGAVTCLYRATPVGGLVSVLGAMAVNEWFLPSVLVAEGMRPLKFCFGATMVVRRAALEAIGGFPALAGYLADDYMLGKLVAGQGYDVVLSSYVVDNVTFEPGLRALLLHELRWARTIQSAQPLGYALSFLTYAIPMSIAAGLAALALGGSVALASVLVAFAVLLRLTLHVTVRSLLGIRAPGAPWLVPLRDLLSFCIWAGGFFARHVRWRGRRLAVGAAGQLAQTPMGDS